MADNEEIDARLQAAFADVHELHPPDGERFAAVVSRARRRTVARRTAGASATLATVLLVAAIASGAGEGPGRLTTTGDPAASEAPASPEPDRGAVPPPMSALRRPAITSPSTMVLRPTTTLSQPARPTPTTRPSLPPPTTATTSASAEPARPPAAYAAHKGVEVQAVQGSSCWRDGNGAGMCADVGSDWADNAPVLEVASQDVIAWRWATRDVPRSGTVFVQVRRAGDESGPYREMGATNGNPSRIQVRLAPGEYLLMVASYWAQGDVSHGIRLTVR